MIGFSILYNCHQSRKPNCSSSLVYGNSVLKILHYTGLTLSSVCARVCVLCTSRQILRCLSSSPETVVILGGVAPDPVLSLSQLSLN